MKYLAIMTALCVLVPMSACDTRTQRVAIENAHQESGVSATAKVAAQASSELALSASGLQVTSNEVTVEDGLHIGDSVVTSRAWIQRDHWHPYQFALIENRVVLLGGFQNPDLASVAEHLSKSGDSTDRIRDLPEKLALLADESGAVRYAFPGRTGNAGLHTAWRQIAPAGWPNDTSFSVENGGITSRVTLLSQDTRSFTQGSFPTVYVFAFDARGRLSAWSRLNGDGVPDRQLASVVSLPK